jgi:hypothetical protein
MTTLAYDAVSIDLHDDMLWTDEYAWSVVSQRREYTVTGAQIIDAGAKQSGRPITLAGGEAFGWLPRTTVDALAVAAAIPGQPFTLTLRGETYTVVFDHASQALEADPVWDVRDPAAADHYVVTLRFIEV